MEQGLAAPQLVEGLVLLGIVAFVTAAFRRAGVTPALGLLAAGVCIGPSGLGIAGRDGVVAVASELGLLFLLFIVGLELSVERIRTMARLVFRYGLLHYLFTSAAVAGVLWAFGVAPAVAGVVGLALGMSSTAFVSEALQTRGWMQVQRGRRVLGGLLFQDLAVGPLFAVLPILGMIKAGESPLVSPAVGAIALVLLFFVARLLLATVLEVAREAGRTDAFPAAVIAAALAMGGTAQALGMSAGIGALLAGVALSDVHWRRDVKRVVEPFKATLLGCVFIGIGMALPVDAGAAQLGLMVLAGVGLMAGKTLAGALAGLLCGQRPRAAIGTALVLAQAGEFAFLILALAGAGGGVPQAMVEFWVGAAVISMALTPPSVLLAEKLMGPPPERIKPEAFDPDRVNWDKLAAAPRENQDDRPAA